MFVQIELADERYCDDCPCMRHAKCLAGMVSVPLYLVREPDDMLHYARPQACIDASAAIVEGLGQYDIKQ